MEVDDFESLCSPEGPNVHDSASVGYVDDSDNGELWCASTDIPKLQSRKEASKAWWVEELGMSEVLVKKGIMWITTGIIRCGKTYCSIEETLYLAEIGALDVSSADDTRLHLSDLYGKLAEHNNRHGCSRETFEVYRHLKFLGYVVGRHNIPWSLKNTKTKLDDLECTTDLFSNLQFSEIRPIFDVYPPNSKFRKLCPGSPLFVLYLISGPPPSNQEIKNLEACCKDSPIKFCVVEDGRVSLLSFTKLDLPILP